MIDKKTKILIGVVLTVVIVAIVIWITTSIGSRTKQEVQKNAIPTPEAVVIPPKPIYNDKSETGAKYISPTDSEYLQIVLIRELRSKCPIENSAFKIDFDYKINKFVVTLKEPKIDNRKVYDKWMEEAGYNKIEAVNFQSIQ